MEGLRVSKLEEGQQWGKNTSLKDKVQWGRRPPFIGGGKSNRYPPTQPAQRGTTAPEARYYRRGTRYYRPRSRDQNSHTCTKAEGGSTAGAVLPLPLAVLPQGRGCPGMGRHGYKNYICGYFRRGGVDAKTRRGSTVSQPRYYRARRGCKKLHPPLTAAYLRN